MSIAEQAVQSSPEAATDPWSDSICLREVPWEMYVAVRDADENKHLRMTYDRGVLEVMSPSGKHAKVGHIIGCMVYEWMMMLNVEFESGGDMTFRRPEAKRGLEPDQCFWIQRVAEIVGKDELDLNVDPPPDLAIEVEVTRNVVAKLPIYQALGVPEIWRWRRGKLEVLGLDAEQGYVIKPDSRALPGFPFALATEFIERRKSGSLMILMREFQDAIRRLGDS